MPINHSRVLKAGISITPRHLGEWRDLTKRKHACVTNGFQSDGVPCNHGFLHSHGSHWSCCGALQFDSPPCKALEKENSYQKLDHTFYTSDCRICTKCFKCSKFGSTCIRVSRHDRSSDAGKPCGCGAGESGCVNCGMCKRCCASQKQCIPRNDQSVNAIPVPSASLTSAPKSYSVNSRVTCQWRRPGGTSYSGRISHVNSDGTYEVQYDDGDHDSRVSSPRITSIAQRSTPVSRTSPRDILSALLPQGPPSVVFPRTTAQSPRTGSSDATTTGRTRPAPDSRSGQPSGLSAWLRGIAEPGAGLQQGLSALEEHLELLARDFGADDLMSSSALARESEEGPDLLQDFSGQLDGASSAGGGRDRWDDGSAPSSPRFAGSDSENRSHSHSRSNSLLGTDVKRLISPAPPSSSTLCQGHSGPLRCACLLQLGRIAPALMHSLHVTVKHEQACLWECCGQVWSSRSECVAVSTPPPHTLGHANPQSLSSLLDHLHRRLLAQRNGVMLGHEVLTHDEVLERLAQTPAPLLTELVDPHTGLRHYTTSVGPPPVLLRE